MEKLSEREINLMNLKAAPREELEKERINFLLVTKYRNEINEIFKRDMEEILERIRRFYEKGE